MVDDKQCLNEDSSDVVMESREWIDFDHCRFYFDSSKSESLAIEKMRAMHDFMNVSSCVFQYQSKKVKGIKLHISPSVSLAILLTKPKTKQFQLLKQEIRTLLDLNESDFLYKLYWLGHKLHIGLVEGHNFTPFTDAEILNIA